MFVRCPRLDTCLIVAMRKKRTIIGKAELHRSVVRFKVRVPAQHSPLAVLDRGHNAAIGNVQTALFKHHRKPRLCSAAASIALASAAWCLRVVTRDAETCCGSRS